MRRLYSRARRPPPPPRGSKAAPGASAGSQGDAAERSSDHPLRRCGRLRHQRGGPVGSQDRREALRDRRQVGGHEHDERVDAPRKVLEIAEITACPVPGHEGDRRRDAAVGHGDPRCRGGGERRADAGNHTHRDSCPAQRIDLLATPAEEERVAPFQSHHQVAGASRGGHRLVDVGLGCRPAARALAGIDKTSAGPHNRNTSGATRASWKTMSASARIARAPMVRRSGSPGPAPARTTSPIGGASEAPCAPCSVVNVTAAAGHCCCLGPRWPRARFARG